MKALRNTYTRVYFELHARLIYYLEKFYFYCVKFKPTQVEIKILQCIKLLWLIPAPPP